jgi:hypothetical protein
MLTDSEKNMQIPQPYAATDLMLAIEFLTHARETSRLA